MKSLFKYKYLIILNLIILAVNIIVYKNSFITFGEWDAVIFLIIVSLIVLVYDYLISQEEIKINYFPSVIILSFTFFRTIPQILYVKQYISSQNIVLFIITFLVEIYILIGTAYNNYINIRLNYSSSQENRNKKMIIIMLVANIIIYLYSYSLYLIYAINEANDEILLGLNATTYLPLAVITYIALLLLFSPKYKYLNKTICYIIYIVSNCGFILVSAYIFAHNATIIKYISLVTFAYKFFEFVKLTNAIVKKDNKTQ